MKGAPNKKILLESAVIRMCAGAKPAADPGEDVSELKLRIAELEKTVNMLKNGTVVKTAAQTVEAPAPKPAPEPVKEEKPVSEPETAKEEPEPETAKQPETPATQAETPAAAGNVEFTSWAEVLEEVKKTDAPLYYMLNTTTSYIRNGTHLVIRTNNSLLYKFITEKDTSHAKDLSAAVAAVTGRRYKLSIDDKGTTAVTQKKNPLDNLKDKIDSFNNSQEDNK